MKNKKGFTLVELLAVIAILAILVIIALPNVIGMYNRAQKQTFLTEAKKVYSESEKKYLSNAISGDKIKVINSEDSSKLDMTGEKLQYCVILNNNGKVTDMKVSNGKWVASLNGKAIEDLTIEDLEEGNLDGYNCSSSTTPKQLNCTFDGELVQGAEYINGQYTYRYMQEYNRYVKEVDNVLNEKPVATFMKSDVRPLINTFAFDWIDMTTEGWGVILTDKDSTNPISGDVCTTINNKPVSSMSYMFYKSKASKIDVSNLNTSKVTNMAGMFANTSTTELDLSNFDTSNVTDMSSMFMASVASKLDLSNFNTSKVIYMENMFYDISAVDVELKSFDTSNVISMYAMFYKLKGNKLDLSSFNTKNVVNMTRMFYGCSNLTTIYASNNFITKDDVIDTDMFGISTKLVGGAGTTYDTTKIDATYAHIDGGTSNPGYFTLKK